MASLSNSATEESHELGRVRSLGVWIVSGRALWNQEQHPSEQFHGGIAVVLPPIGGPDTWGPFFGCDEISLALSRAGEFS